MTTLKNMAVLDIDSNDPLIKIDNDIEITRSMNKKKSDKRSLFIFEDEEHYLVIETNGFVLQSTYENALPENGWSTVGKKIGTYLSIPLNPESEQRIEKGTVLAELLEQKYPQLKD